MTEFEDLAIEHLKHIEHLIARIYGEQLTQRDSKDWVVFVDTKGFAQVNCLVEEEEE